MTVSRPQPGPRAGAAVAATPLLEVRDLTVRFATETGGLLAVRDLCLTLSSGETLAILGESGSGKSVLAQAILRLVPPPGEIVSGDVLLAGRSLRAMPERELI